MVLKRWAAHAKSPEPKVQFNTQHLSKQVVKLD